ncbi:hypothetical protein PV326_000249 [Microctonus aethiopoides]|nr:hypothetical protein PV326_000249 [Microctonus aethiopoides]
MVLKGSRIVSIIIIFTVHFMSIELTSMQQNLYRNFLWENINPEKLGRDYTRSVSYKLCKMFKPSDKFDKKIPQSILGKISKYVLSTVFTNGTETDTARRGGGFYLWKDFPLDELSKTPKFRSFYQFCFAGEDRCPIDDKSLIKLIPEMMKDDCASCTSRQKYLANTVLTYLKENDPDQYQIFLKKFKPPPTQ